MPTTCLPEYLEVTDALTPVLSNLPPRVIAITGPMGAGKTTLGRYLAWHFNATLLETDLFLISMNPWEHRVPDIKRIIELRLGMNRPVFVDGVVALQLLVQMQLMPDFIVRVNPRKEDQEESLFPASPSLVIDLKHS